ncbi:MULTISPECIES: acetyl-CoA carboxylase biotin carboxyl carrier protein subunit [Brevibacillus]|jgi:acetyl-CoA carboxylase biotin carboxyl carrier protein|uniref:Acetyl-CoA carboxylase biotin carboxyl carrier protein n=2 Tax=Brevibacillus TaxID=55080 RepID=A0A1I3SVM2_9BACL|nr:MULTISPECIES: acetyl-CoA carboxylase biotin carboxyl carrier protein subunit [Brevibacillus]MDR7318199.1 acetyl-CoA carboxylase biotin carboxyl carrier protein [Brevibacillus nitrificans]MEC2128140.1 acetyl-CoA carboxylase biotin carboxyl carrier protein subunit [Brevibacillus centrosporus]MED1951610.1 acetyl-CoA carboxylase biotin carboxyl carrier protein subunit [Brevibacillus centrosporus]MED4909561.1 acetyl-CoA carboxylase biotin carboxyl carrier protein subunit [Brevibacillus centrospor
MKQVAANMAGTVINVLVQVGDEISAGQDVVVLESMKMEVPVQAEVAGKVVEVKANIGDFVNEGDILVSVE